MALFGGTADERREPRSLVEFRAGKMSLSQGVVTADKRKGLVYMKTSSDSLLHFCWKDRQTGEVVDVRPYYINFPQPFPCLSHISLTFTHSQTFSLFSSLCFLFSPSFPPSSLHLLPTPLHLLCKDLIIFPGEAEFVTIPQCTTGRVFLLKFKDHSSRKFFYWMQEPSNSKDKELAKKVGSK